MTPGRPRPFLVVLATAVASQDGVVAAGDSVRNCRTRPSAEQRLLPVIGHPVPGKCEPRFPFLPTFRQPRRSRKASHARPESDRSLAGSAGSQLRAGKFPLVTSASRAGLEARIVPCPQPPAPLVPGKPWPPHNVSRSLPATRRSYPSSSLRAKKKKTVVRGLRAASPSAWEGGKEKTQPSVPRRSWPGRGEREDFFSRVGFNYGRFCTFYRGLLRIYQGQGHIKKNFLVSGRNWALEAFPLPFWSPFYPIGKRAGRGLVKNVSAALCVSPTHKWHLLYNNKTADYVIARVTIGLFFWLLELFKVGFYEWFIVPTKLTSWTGSPLGTRFWFSRRVYLTSVTEIFVHLALFLDGISVKWNLEFCITYLFWCMYWRFHQFFQEHFNKINWLVASRASFKKGIMCILLLYLRFLNIACVMSILQTW